MASLTGHRVECIRVEWLNRMEKLLGVLDGVESGSLSWQAYADLPGSGTLVLEERNQQINTSSDRIRVWWVVEGYGEWALGVYVLASPSRSYTADGSSRELTLLDKLTIPRNDCLTETLQFTAGSNIIASAVSVLQSTGETAIAYTTSDSTLSNDISWPPGTTKQQVINDLLTTAGYSSLWTDRLGQFRMEPYVAPADRPVIWEFKSGDTSIHLPDWKYELPLWDATNMVVLTSKADDDDNVMYASAVDQNPDSPTSIVNMGRVLNPIIEENVEARDQVDLQAQANRKLLDNSNTVGRITVQHAPVPLWFNDAVWFSSQGQTFRATVINQSLELTPGALVQAEWRQA